MAGKNAEYDQELEDMIIRIVEKFREKRSRPCYQNIFSQLNKEGRIIGMEDLQVFINNMIHTGLLIKKGADGKESFYLNHEENIKITCEPAELSEENIEPLPSLEKYINSFMQLLLTE